MMQRSVFKYLLLIAMMINTAYPSDNLIVSDDNEYVTFLRTNLARYIAVSRREAHCPRNTSLLHGELLEACTDDSTVDNMSIETSQQALQNYTLTSEKYNKWFKPLELVDVPNQLPQCPSSMVEGGKQAECVLDRLASVKLEEYWPFNLQVIRKNQILGLFSAMNEFTDENDRALKKKYFEVLEMIQDVSLPFHPEEILTSFRDGELVKTLTDYGFPGNPVDFIYGGKHLYSRKEQAELEELTRQAMQLIYSVDEQLHQSMLQAIGVWAFYRSYEKLYLGGSNGKLIGLVWLEPPANWSVYHLAEELIHEYIHNVLFQAEIVHGLMREDEHRKTIESWSCIRLGPRPFDKALHAAVVSTGLIHFHSKSLKKLPEKRQEIIPKVTKLLNTLDRGIKELKENHSKYQVLTAPGAAILDHMTDIATIASFI